MESFQEYMPEYKKQLKKGSIQKAYKGLMEYIMGLRRILRKNILVILYLAAFTSGIWI